MYKVLTVCSLKPWMEMPHNTRATQKISNMNYFFSMPFLNYVKRLCDRIMPFGHACGL